MVCSWAWSFKSGTTDAEGAGGSYDKWRKRAAPEEEAVASDWGG